jgi:signal transduction histidine kinase
MVADLLEMSRVDAGSMDVFLEEVNVAELVQRSVDGVRRGLADGEVLPEADIAPAVRPLHVGVDKRRFERVMANLLENAAHYGGGATRITVALDPATPSVVEIAVEDSGPGINESERERVFERFYRGSASGRRGTGTGTGLGLALVAEHMRLMQGRAWVEASSGGGARFVVALPVMVGDDDGDPDDDLELDRPETVSASGATNPENGRVIP